jgi:hypothetical protein
MKALSVLLLGLLLSPPALAKPPQSGAYVVSPSGDSANGSIQFWIDETDTTLNPWGTPHPVSTSEPLPVAIVSGGTGGGSTGGSVTAPGTNGTNAQAVQGITGGIPQPVSATSLPLPTGAALATNQTLSFGPITPGTATATESNILGCQYSTLTTWTLGWQGSAACDNQGRVLIGSSTVQIGTVGLVAGGAVIGTALTTPKTATFVEPGCSIGVASAVCLASGLGVNHLTLQNNSTNQIACNWGGTANLSSATSFQLSPGQSALWGPTTAGVPSGALSCIATAAASILYVEYN